MKGIILAGAAGARLHPATEELAYWMGYVNAAGFLALDEPLAKSDYGRYPLELMQGLVAA